MLDLELTAYYDIHRPNFMLACQDKSVPYVTPVSVNVIARIVCDSDVGAVVVVVVVASVVVIV